MHGNCFKKHSPWAISETEYNIINFMRSSLSRLVLYLRKDESFMMLLKKYLRLETIS